MAQRASKDERGVALILALVLLTIGSFIVLSLATQASTNLTDTIGLTGTRTDEYAAGAALDSAIEANRYHQASVPTVGQTSCKSFPATGWLKMDSGVYVQVNCSGTPMALSYASGTHTLSTAFPNAFIPDDVGLTVVNAMQESSHTTISGYTSSSTVTLTSPLTTTSVVVEPPADQRLDLFWACVSSTGTGTCGQSSTPAGTAVVLYTDTDQNGNTTDQITGYPNTGFNMTIKSWVLSGTQG